MIRWIFFDLGDVIFNEDYLRFILYETLFRYLRKENPDLEFKALMALRRKYILKYNSESPILAIAQDNLPERDFNRFREELLFFYKKYHGKYIKIVPGMKNLLLKLKYRFSLGIIANQPSFIQSFLKVQKLDGFFRAIYISDIVGIKKPDIRIFQKALDENKISPGEAIYVGNRMEHDILPSHKAGFIPIMAYFTPEVKGFVPSTYYEREFFNAITELPEWPQNLNIARRYVPVVLTPRELADLDWENPDHYKPVKNEEQEPELSLGELLKKFLLGDIGD